MNYSLGFIAHQVWLDPMNIQDCG